MLVTCNRQEISLFHAGPSVSAQRRWFGFQSKARPPRPHVPFPPACHRRRRRRIPLRLVTHPARRPTTPTATAFLGATSTPTPRAEPATPVPDIPGFLLHASSSSPPPPPPPPVPVSVPRQKQKQQGGGKHGRSSRLIRSVRAAFRSFPIIPAPSCISMPSLHGLPILHGAGGVLRSHFHGATSATGTMYGHRRARITVAFHESPGSPPCLLLDIAVPTAKFIQDVSAAGMVRVTLECEKQNQQQQQQHPETPARRPLLDEPLWTAEVNGESVGYASRREATEQDDRVMQMLHATSMGAGVLPPDMAHPADGELTYMRAHFDRVVGSKDSETYYMHNPEGSATGPELTIFFIRT